MATRVTAIAFCLLIATTAAFAQSPPVQKLSPDDYMEINNLYARYTRAADMGGAAGAGRMAVSAAGRARGDASDGRGAGCARKRHTPAGG